MKKFLFAGFIALLLLGMSRQSASAWCFQVYKPHIQLPAPIIPVIIPSFSFSCPTCGPGMHGAGRGMSGLGKKGHCASCQSRFGLGGGSWGNSANYPPQPLPPPWYSSYPTGVHSHQSDPYAVPNPYAPPTGYAQYPHGATPAPSYWYGH